MALLCLNFKPSLESLSPPIISSYGLASYSSYHSPITARIILDVMCRTQYLCRGTKILSSEHLVLSHWASAHRHTVLHEAWTSHSERKVFWTLVYEFILTLYFEKIIILNHYSYLLHYLFLLSFFHQNFNNKLGFCLYFRCWAGEGSGTRRIIY